MSSINHSFHFFFMQLPTHVKTVGVAIYVSLYQVASNVLVLKVVSYCLIEKTVKCVCIYLYFSIYYDVSCCGGYSLNFCKMNTHSTYFSYIFIHSIIFLKISLFVYAIIAEKPTTTPMPQDSTYTSGIKTKGELGFPKI